MYKLNLVLPEPTKHAKAILDPLEAHADKAPSDLLNALGYLPHWAALALQDSPEDVLGAMREDYGMPAPAMDGGTLSSRGVYFYPEDPPLYPIAVMYAGATVVLFYEYAMFAVVTKAQAGDTWTMTRMD